ncbi:glutamate--tRNA ligase [Sulfurimonas sp.]
MLRFAPSPTGDMHIGDLRVALFNYIVSKQKNEGLVVRIEDIDKQKYIDGKDKEILDILDLFEIEYSQTIYQSENIRFHSAMALQLMHEKKAFCCFCSDEWLDGKKEEAKANKKAYRYDDACANLPDELVIDNTAPFTIRINKPTPLADDVDSFVIMKQDKTPTYNFACAVDDMLNDISIVIRDEKHKSNTPKQAHVRTALKYEKHIEYTHIPTIINDDKISVKWLLEEGFLPEAISNYLISIGNKTPKEIFTFKESAEWLSLENLSKSHAHFDIAVLRDINKEHLKMLDAKELSRYVGFADEDIGELAKVYLEDASTTKELRAMIEPIFAPKEIAQEFSEKVVLMQETIKKAPYFEEYDDFKNYIVKKTGLKDEDFNKPLRLLLTGAEDGPDLAKIYKFLKNYIGEIAK